MNFYGPLIKDAKSMPNKVLKFRVDICLHFGASRKSGAGRTCPSPPPLHGGNVDEEEQHPSACGVQTSTDESTTDDMHGVTQLRSWNADSGRQDTTTSPRIGHSSDSAAGQSRVRDQTRIPERTGQAGQRL